MSPSDPPSVRDRLPEDASALRREAQALGVGWLEELSDEMLDPALIAGIPVEWARANRVLPIRCQGEPCLLLAALGDWARQEEVALLLGCELRPLLAAPSVIADGIERCYFRRGDSAAKFLRDMKAAAEPAAAASVSRPGEDLLHTSEEAPITQLVNLILLEAVKARASDIHFEPYLDRLRVRYRIDGILYEQSAPPKHLERPLVSRLKVMAHLDIAEKRLPQDGMAKVRVGEREIDIRVSTVPVAEGERVVLRLLNQESSLLPLADLGMPTAVRSRLEELLRAAHGIVIVAGPTGSGKTTTLYAALGTLDALRRNIMTIEDPIEYQLPNIAQIQVHPKIGLTFALGLRHVLRQDPDVILVGETRDLETAEIAIRASLTGHLVFTTLHTNDAASAVIRLMDLGIEPYLLAAALRGVVAQRLVRKLCPVCRRETSLSEEELARLGVAGAGLRGVPVWKPNRCGSCLEGYWGRVGLFEMLPVDEGFHELIRTGQGTARALRAAATARGLPTLLDDGIEKIRQGVSSLDEVLYALGPAHQY
jgi:general secretion pathway protein E